MSVKLKCAPKFLQSPRIERLAAASRELALSGKRFLYTADETQLVYHWTEKCNAIVPQSGDWAFPPEQNLSLGDHACRVESGMDFPKLKEMPSRVYGYEATPESWGRDYAFLLVNTPPTIHPDELIVGEFHWEMNEVRKYEFPPEVFELGRQARELGAGGTSHGHTCLDLAIGLKLGWSGILQKIDRNIAKYERLHNESKLSFLRGARYCCTAVIDWIGQYAALAEKMAAEASTAAEKERLEKIAATCSSLAKNAPQTYHEAVQFIQFAVLTDRMVGHGNGYGRLDQYLIDFYKRDLAAGSLTREEAREYLAEMFLKLRGQFFCLGGRDRDGKDATNDISYIVMEAYDMIDDYNNLGVMWHPDMDPKFYDYVCDVLARHGAGIPSLVNYDLIRDAELRSGIPEDVAWNVAYSGCQWFCIPGMEYCDQDVNALNLIDPMKRAIDCGIAENVADFEGLYTLFIEEFQRTVAIMRKFKDVQYDALPYVWPEIMTSLNCHGPIERGLDMTAPRGVDVQFTSTNILGIPNVADSLFAIAKLVFEEKAYTLADVREATRTNWEGREPMRLRFLKQHKYGNDLDDVDALYVRITESIAEILDRTTNNRGQCYRASLFQFQGHTCPGIIGATPDGRLADEPLAHGCNPTAGRNKQGLIATANSMAKVDNVKFQGGSLQIEMQPKFFDGRENMGEYIRNFSETFFRRGGVQINLNIMDLEELKKAIDDPMNPEYRNIIVKVTGYTSRFITLAKKFQQEFVSRENYKGF
ncbi:MAG TPA: pyruvate formate lyase family protein [Lentisphaeria bacterium]|nr:pyruvate formate lyase family protein [Lentisphaeria bacterium]